MVLCVPAVSCKKKVVFPVYIIRHTFVIAWGRPSTVLRNRVGLAK